MGNSIPDKHSEGLEWSMDELLKDLDKGDYLYLTPQMCAEVAKVLRRGIDRKFVICNTHGFVGLEFCPQCSPPSAIGAKAPPVPDELDTAFRLFNLTHSNEKIFTMYLSFYQHNFWCDVIEYFKRRREATECNCGHDAIVSSGPYVGGNHAPSCPMALSDGGRE